MEEIIIKIGRRVAHPFFRGISFQNETRLAVIPKKEIGSRKGIGSWSAVMGGDPRLELFNGVRFFIDGEIVDLNPKELSLKKIGEDIGCIRSKRSRIGMETTLFIKLPDLLGLLFALDCLMKFRKRHPKSQRTMLSLNPLAAIDDEMNRM